MELLLYENFWFIVRRYDVVHTILSSHRPACIFEFLKDSLPTSLNKFLPELSIIDILQDFVDTLFEDLTTHKLDLSGLHKLHLSVIHVQRDKLSHFLTELGDHLRLFPSCFILHIPHPRKALKIAYLHHSGHLLHFVHCS